MQSTTQLTTQVTARLTVTCGLLLTLMLATACSTTPSITPPVNQSTTPSSSKAQTANIHNPAQVKSALYVQLKHWRGVRYKEGGLSKKGIDCSGFIHVTFRDRFGMKVPRSTELLEQVGKPIATKHLKPGDLVFFKTGIAKHHVGIYVENGKFIHASTSKGVMLSDMKNVYWSKHYWKSVRIVT